jgi:choline dehydrogenase-like flavoprotein
VKEIKTKRRTGANRPPARNLAVPRNARGYVARDAVIASDVIIVGSGFGAMVAATAIATSEPRLRINILERGIKWGSLEQAGAVQKKASLEPAQFWPEPNDLSGLPAFFSILQLGPEPNGLRSTPPLYHYSAFDDVHVVTASGVGGGSLIYSNVSLPPYRDPLGGAYPVLANWPMRLGDADFQAAAEWMHKWRGDTSGIVTSVPLDTKLLPYIDDLSKVPDGNYEYLYLGHSDALRRASGALTLPPDITMREGWKPVPLQVLEHMLGRSELYRGRRFCERQGRCILGCTPGSMNTLALSLDKLQAMNSNVTLHTSVNATRISSKAPGLYSVECKNLTTSQHVTFESPMVVLAAGTLGSTAILLRSRDSIVVSDQLGRRFSTNGDFSGFIDGVPSRFLKKWIMPTVGPINSCSTRFSSGRLYMTIEDAGIPRMFARMVRALLDVSTKTDTRNKEILLRALGSPDINELFRLLENHPLYGAMSDDLAVKDVFWFNCMGNDQISGRIELDAKGSPIVNYAQKPSQDQIYATIEKIMHAFASAMGGTYVPTPTWNGLLDRKLMVTHPLGGCSIGRSASDGVVDVQGRVFNTRSDGNTTHKGLYVMDGSVLPGPVGANPTLTIVAVVLRMTKCLKPFATSFANN